MKTQIAAGSESANAWPRVIPPDQGIFAKRALRFHELASGHALGDWLGFLGRITQAQHAELLHLRDLPLPDADALELAHRNGMPPLPAHLGQPPGIWLDVLHSIAAAVAEHASEPAQRTLARLERMPTDRLAALATRVLRADLRGDDLDLLPFIGAALQVVWTGTAAALGSAGIPPLDVMGVCPCCGSLPSISIVRGAGEINNLRYLHCSLCNTEWNLSRVHCASCNANTHVAYRQIGDARQPAAMRAETCDDCESYLKILYREKSASADPIADDLATLALDVLVDEAGYARAGPNLLFVPGA